MKRFLLTSVVLVLATVALPALAQDVQNADPSGKTYGSGHGTPRDTTPQPVIELQPVALPTATGNGNGGSAASSSSDSGGSQPVATKVGPTAQSFSLGDAGTGGMQGMLTPRGSTMSSPKQQADREIRRLIRKLD